MDSIIFYTPPPPVQPTTDAQGNRHCVSGERPLSPGSTVYEPCIPVTGKEKDIVGSGAVESVNVTSNAPPSRSSVADVVESGIDYQNDLSRTCFDRGQTDVNVDGDFHIDGTPDLDRHNAKVLGESSFVDTPVHDPDRLSRDDWPYHLVAGASEFQHGTSQNPNGSTMDIPSLETEVDRDLDGSIASMNPGSDVQATGFEGNEDGSEESLQTGRLWEVKSVDRSSTHSSSSNFEEAWYLSDGESRAFPSPPNLLESYSETLEADEHPIEHISDADMDDEDPISATQKRRNRQRTSAAPKPSLLRHSPRRYQRARQTDRFRASKPSTACINHTTAHARAEQPLSASHCCLTLDANDENSCNSTPRPKEPMKLPLGLKIQTIGSQTWLTLPPDLSLLISISRSTCSLQLKLNPVSSLPDQTANHCRSYGVADVPRRSRRRFTERENLKLIDLKDNQRCSWEEIARSFPRRSKGTLQVHYSKNLKGKGSGMRQQQKN